MRTKFKHNYSVILTLGLLLFAQIVSCKKEEPTFSAVLSSLKELNANQKNVVLDKFVRFNPFPFIEDSVVYFLFRDTTDQPVFLAGDMTRWRPDSIQLMRIKDTNYRYTSIVLPTNARIEYKFVAGKKWYLDPFNPFKETGGLGSNSVLMMPDYRFPKEVLLKTKFMKSSLDTVLFRSKILKNKRRVYYYHHPEAKDESPLLIFNDGGDYLRFGKARTILDNLIGEGKIKPINALFVDPVNRNKEYWFNDRYLKMIFNELLPQMKQKYKIKNRTLGMGGASLGGVISLYALKSYGEQLGFVFSQSGAIWIDKEKIIDILKDVPVIKAKVFLSFGEFENMNKSHDRLEKVFSQKSVRYVVKSFPEGHNWGNWRGHLDEMLNNFDGGQEE